VPSPPSWPKDQGTDARRHNGVYLLLLYSSNSLLSNLQRHYNAVPDRPYGLSDDQLMAVKPVPIMIKRGSESSPSQNEMLCTSSIRETWSLYQEKLCTPKSLVEETFFRLRYLQPGYRMFKDSFEDLAIEAASKESVEFDKRRAKPTKRAAGLLFHTKDHLFHSKELPQPDGSWVKMTQTTEPSSHMASLQHDFDDPWVTQLCNAGAVFLGTTAAPEFGIGSDTTNLPTRNPHDPSKTTGESSGGAASAIAAGIGHIGLASDGAGSIRISASFNGVVGLKPRSNLRAPSHLPGRRAGARGLLGRSVEDCAIALDALCGTDDHWNSLHPPLLDLEASAPFKAQPTIAVLPCLSYIQQNQEVTQVFNGAIKRLERNKKFSALYSLRCVDSLGFQHSKDLDPIRAAQDWWSSHISAQFHQHNFGKTTPFVQHFDTLSYKIYQRWDGLSAAERELRVAYASGVQQEIVRSISAFFETNDVDFLLTPTVAQLPFDLNFLRSTLERQLSSNIDCGRLTNFEWNPYTYLFNWTDQAAISLPCGYAEGTRELPLPIGMQIVARKSEDDHLHLLNTAQQIEAALNLPLSYTPTFQHLRYGGLNTV